MGRLLGRAALLAAAAATWSAAADMDREALLAALAKARTDLVRKRATSEEALERWALLCLALAEEGRRGRLVSQARCEHDRAEGDARYDALVANHPDAVVPYADYAGLQMQVQVDKVAKANLRFQLAQLKADNELLLEQTNLDTLSQPISDYLRHATGTDDVVPA